MTDAVSPRFERDSENDNNDGCGAGSFYITQALRKKLELKLTIQNIRTWSESQKVSKTAFKETLLFLQPERIL